MKLAKLLYLAAGAALFVALLFAFDLKAALALVWQAGPLGVAGLCFVFFGLFALDALMWHLLVPELPLGIKWYRRLLRVRLVGEASYQAGSWPVARRVIIKAEVLAPGPNIRFVVTNRPETPERL